MGEGSVYQLPDGSWMAQKSIGGRLSRRYRRRRAATKREALARLASLDAELRAGVQSSRVTVGDYLEGWVRDVRNIRPSTQHGYEVAVRLHLAPTIGGIRLAALSPLDVERMLSVLAPSMSPKMLRNVHAVLRRALNAAVRAGLVPRNVAGREYVDAPRVPTVEPQPLTAAQVRRVLDAARGDRLEALFIVAVGTGLRQGELLGLAWEDVDLDAGAIHVRRELVYRDGRYAREEPKTDRSRRVVPLSPALVAALRAHRERLVAAGFMPIPGGPVFTSPSGGPLNGSWVTHRFYRLLADAGIPRVPFKNLRTTFASRLFAAGVPDRRIADLLGHTRTRTTQGHYIGAGDDWAPALEAVEALVG